MAKENRSFSFTSLNHYIDMEWLHYAYQMTRKDGAVGTDGQTHDEYSMKLTQNLESLLQRLKSGEYKAPAVRRAYIEKPDKSRRPLGIPTFEDKIAQRAIVLLLEPIYEQDFKNCSFGFRPGLSAHQALRSLRNNIMDQGGRWVLDVDIRKYFDSIDHSKLREFLSNRVNDGVIRRLIDKWLKAGIMEEGNLTFPDAGTPQGGVASPLLANVYLHYVLDTWFEEIVKPLLKKRSSLVRYCDDFVMVFEDHTDCKRVYSALEKRMSRYSLSLHPEKTQIVDFRFKRPENHPSWMDLYETKFSFLGFSHVWGRSLKGKPVVYQLTAKDRIARTLARINLFCRKVRHWSLPDQYKSLCQKLNGHYAYFGITGNHRQLRKIKHGVERIWKKWLSKRSRESEIPWKEFHKILTRFPLPTPRIVHVYSSS